jgi:hypothetical protein
MLCALCILSVALAAGVLLLSSRILGGLRTSFVLFNVAYGAIPMLILSQVLCAAPILSRIAGLDARASERRRLSGRQWLVGTTVFLMLSLATSLAIWFYFLIAPTGMPATTTIDALLAVLQPLLSIAFLIGAVVLIAQLATILFIARNALSRATNAARAQGAPS